MTGVLELVLRTIPIFLTCVIVVALVLTAPGSAAAAPDGTIVLVTPDAPELDAALRDATTAQFSGVAAELLFEHFRPPEATLRAQAAAAREIAAQKRAAGVFWLDTANTKQWLLYLAEPAEDRLLMRRIPVENDATSASAESVAVILRQSTEALLSGQVISMQPIILPEEKSVVCPEPPPAPPPLAPRPPPRHGPRLGVMFHGDSFATAVGFAGGPRLSGAWLWDSGLYAGLGYTYFRDAAVTTPEIAFRLRRTPVDADFGYAFFYGRFVPAVEARLTADWVSRKNGSTVPSLDRTTESTRVLLSISPVARVDFAVVPSTALHLALGADFLLNHFSYVIRADSQDVTVLEPLRVRPSLELGITVRL